MKRLCTDPDLKDFFKDGKPHSIEEVKDHFKVSRIVAYRELKRIKAFRSINKTSYYLLPRIGHSTRNGLLKVEEKVFFSGGDLSDALVRLIAKSIQG